jgi:transposase
MEELTTYVGLDDHKDSIQLSVRKPEGELVRTTLVNDVDPIRKLFRRLVAQAPGAVVCCYEAGPNGYTLKRRIEATGAQCLVIAPSLTPVRPGQRIKTNRRDADKLVELLASGLLVEVHPPTPEQEAIRDLCRCREAAHQDLVRCRHRLSKLLLRRGLVFRAGRAWSRKHREWAWSLRFEHAADQAVFDDYRLAIEQLEARLGQLDGQLQTAAASGPYAEKVGWLRCFRGIDTVTALSVVAELYGFERFTTARQLMAFLGLVPSESSTGDRQRRGSITKTGNSHVRRLLIETTWHYRRRPAVGIKLRARRAGQPAWVTAHADRAQQRLYSRYGHLLLGRGKPHNVVIVALARELTGFLWSVLQPGQTAA